MSGSDGDRGEKQTSVIPLRRLSDAIRDVKNAAADREDVVVELREATRMRLQLLAAELAPVFAEVPDDIDTFDFAISSGLQPRLWIDSVAMSPWAATGAPTASSRIRASAASCSPRAPR